MALSIVGLSILLQSNALASREPIGVADQSWSRVSNLTRQKGTKGGRIGGMERPFVYTSLPLFQ